MKKVTILNPQVSGGITWRQVDDMWLLYVGGMVFVLDDANASRLESTPRGGLFDVATLSGQRLRGSVE